LKKKERTGEWRLNFFLQIGNKFAKQDCPCLPKYVTAVPLPVKIGEAHLKNLE